MEGKGRAPVVGRFELPPKKAICSSVIVPDKNPSHDAPWIPAAHTGVSRTRWRALWWTERLTDPQAQGGLCRQGLR